MTERELLKSARALLAHEGVWCQGASALDEGGLACSPESRWAVSWCLIGAVETIAAQNAVKGSITVSALDIILRTIDGPDHEGIVSWNDATGRTQDQVLTLLDSAITGLDTVPHCSADRPPGT